MLTSDDELKAGDRVVVRLPPDVAGWVRPDGAHWRGVVAFVNGDSVDVLDDDGVVEPVDSEYVERESSGMIAALFVQHGGCYFGLEGVDPWDQRRDARKYAGPWPAVAHPPCARWGAYATGGPGAFAWLPGMAPKKGDDGGCFASALESVRRWGGVIEHPARSHAWQFFGLSAPPAVGGWVKADKHGWTCHVEQGAYGHRARKATWLYAVGSALPELRWGSAAGDFVPESEGRSRDDMVRAGMVSRLSKRERAATPPEFRDLLISIARTASTARAAV